MDLRLPTFNPGTLNDWMPIRWYRDRERHDIEHLIVELGHRDLDPDDALGLLRTQAAYDRGDAVVHVHRCTSPEPFDDLGADLKFALDRVNFLHPTSGGWLWFRALRVRANTPGAVALSATRWTAARETLGNDWAGPGPTTLVPVYTCDSMGDIVIEWREPPANRDHKHPPADSA